jgi:hypothetical protein
VTETPTHVPQTAPPAGDPEADLIAAQQERIRLLEAALAAKNVEPEETPGLYDLDELFVAEGQGTCLECSCVEWRAHPQQGGPTCWLCGHDRGLHKRHPDGAQAKP